MAKAAALQCRLVRGKGGKVCLGWSLTETGSQAGALGKHARLE